MPQVGEKLENILKGNGQPSDQYQLVQVKSLDSETPAYYNHVHQDGRVILCMYNFASMDLNKERMHWSDLMAVSASRVMNVNGGSTMEQLEAIWRISIVNDETNGVIDAIDHRIHGDTGRMDEERFFELTTEDGDEFFALLGTVHRKGPARMFGCISEVLRREEDGPGQGISRRIPQSLLVSREAEAQARWPPLSQGQASPEEGDEKILLYGLTTYPPTYISHHHPPTQDGMHLFDPGKKIPGSVGVIHTRVVAAPWS
ncbi:hypothetical protein Trihar35433_7229 [Trichoderma harzianum]|nr:hypothetical protein Trihar35433_7229 [Trichoderma harzianum]